LQKKICGKRVGKQTKDFSGGAPLLDVEGGGIKAVTLEKVSGNQTRT